MGKYIIKKSEGTFIDPYTGEIKSYSNSVELVKCSTEPFFLIYIKQIMPLYTSSLFNTTTKVFFKLLEYAEFNTGTVHMNNTRRQEIMGLCGISRTSYYRAIDDLIKFSILNKNGDTYVINESMFWKGDRKIRDGLQKSKRIL